MSQNVTLFQIFGTKLRLPFMFGSGSERLSPKSETGSWEEIRLRLTLRVKARIKSIDRPRSMIFEAFRVDLFSISSLDQFSVIQVF